MAASPGAANACPTRAMARPRKPPWPPCNRCRNRCGGGWTGRPCKPQCRQALPATRWIVRCWTSKPRAPASAPGSCSDARPRGPVPRPTPSRWDRRRRWRQRPPRPRTGRCSRSSSAAMAMATALRQCAGPPRIRAHRRRQRGLDRRQSRATSRRMRRGRRHPCRAAAAGRPGPGAGAHPQAAFGLRRRERA